MNKNIIFLGVLAMVSVITSCSSEDSDVVANSKTIKTFAETVYYNGEIDYQNTSNFNYESGKLVSITDGSKKLEILYNGDKIIRANNYNNNNVLTGYNTLTYEGLLLKSILNDDEDEKTEYSYLNGILSSMTNSYRNGSEWESSRSQSYVLSNGNIQSSITSWFGSSFKNSFEYDVKHNPMKNMNPYLKYIFQVETCDFISSNNVLKKYYYSNMNDVTGVLSHQYIIVYDADNYPINVKKYSINNSEQSLISESVITYN
jgi:hypothetical protein